MKNYRQISSRRDVVFLLFGVSAKSKNYTRLSELCASAVKKICVYPFNLCPGKF